jgi:hypothetical protein
MKARFTFLVVLFLLTTSSYALEPAHNKSSKLTGSFLTNRLERTEGITKHNPFQRKMGFQKQSNSLKSAQAIKQRLDGYTSMALDEVSGQWYEDEKAEFVYDTNWNLILERDYDWDEMTNQLIYDWKAEYTYDAHGNLTQEIYLRLDGATNQFLVDGKYTNTYDGNGNLTQSMDYEWNNIINQLVVTYKTNYTYDVVGNLNQEITSYIDDNTNQLAERYKSDYEYNSSGKESQIIQSYWDNTSSKWVQGWKTESTYDSKGNLTLSLLSYWDYNGSWIPSSKEEFKYNNSGKLILDARYNYNDNQWEPSSRVENSYDEHGNNTQLIGYYDWDSSTSLWNENWKEEYTYDYNYTESDLIVPYWWEEDLELSNTNMLTKINESYWNGDTNKWESNYKSTLLYSPVNVTSANQLNTEISSVYPNPCSESFSLTIPGSYSRINFELFDLQGRKLFSKAIGSGEKVNMEGFRSGMYLYKLYMDGKVQDGKLVKE